MGFAFVAGSAFLASACGMRFDSFRGERAQIPVSEQGASAGCLTGATDVLNQFWEGTADPEKLGRFWDCASESIQTFSQRARGSRPGVYTPKELRGFLETYFIRDFKVNAALLEQAMALKVFFIGGNLNEVTVGELHRTQKMIALLKKITLGLLPLMPLEQTAVSEEQIFERIQKLESGAQSVILAIEGMGGAYSIGNLAALLDELERLPVGMQGPESRVAWAKAQLPYVRAVKLAVVGGKAGMSDWVPNGEWTQLLRTLVSGYSLYLRYQYLNAHYPLQPYPVWTKGASRARTYNWAQDVLNWIEQVMRRRDGGAVPYGPIDELLAQVQWKTWIGVDTAAILRLTHTLNETLLQSGNKQGFTPKTVQTLRSALVEWNLGQQLLESHFQESESAELGDHFKLSTTRPMTVGVPAGGFNGKTLDISEILFRSPALFGDGVSEVTYPAAGQTKVPHTFSEMSQLNWMWQAASALVRVYQDGNPRGVSVAGLRRFYLDIREVGVQLKLFDPEDPKVPEKRFREANLFLPSSDGDSTVSKREGMELLAFLISTKSVSLRVHSALTGPTQCGNGGALDIYGKRTVSSDCFRKYFYAGLETFIAQWPEMLKYYRKLPTAERIAFEQKLEYSGRKKGVDLGNPVTSADIEGIVGVLQYAEAVFQRFDRDGNGMIEDPEVDQAFPVFLSTLKQLAATLAPDRNVDEKDLHAIFRYLLATGEIPGALQVGWWRYVGGGSVHATRGMLISIFAQLAKSQ